MMKPHRFGRTSFFLMELGIVFLVPTTHISAQEFVCDNFDECIGDLQSHDFSPGSATPDSGDLRIKNTLNPGGGGGTAVFYPEITGDVSVRVRGRIESGGIGLLARFSHADDADDGGYFLSASDELGFGFTPEVASQFFQEYDFVDVGQVAGLETDVWIQLDAIGDSFKAWLWHDGDPQPDSPQLSFTIPENQIPIGGTAGVWAFDGESVIREIQITAIPEPSSFILVAVAAFLLVIRRRW